MCGIGLGAICTMQEFAMLARGLCSSGGKIRAGENDLGDNADGGNNGEDCDEYIRIIFGQRNPKNNRTKSHERYEKLFK